MKTDLQLTIKQRIRYLTRSWGKILNGDSNVHDGLSSFLMVGLSDLWDERGQKLLKGGWSVETFF